MLQVNQKQDKAIESVVVKQQLKQLILEYADEFEQQDVGLAEKIRSAAEEPSTLNAFSKIYDLTDERDYQKALLALYIDTGVNFFETPEFGYVMNHPFLTGNSKARHIVLSSLCLIEQE